MDPNQNNTNQSLGQQAPVQPVDRQQQQYVQPQPQAPSVTPRGKEAAPVPVQPVEATGYIAPASHETVPDLPQEVEQAGVEVTPQQQEVRLSNDQKAVGIQPAKESVPLPTNPQITFSSPLTYEEAVKESGGKADHSKTWLGKLIVFVLGQQQYNKKE